MTTSLSPASNRVDDDGFVLKSPFGLRTAKIRVPARSRTCASPIVAPASSELAAKAMGAAPDAYGLVLTHDHALDYALVSAGLAGGGFSYFGVIGSKTKRARFMSRLRDDGFDVSASELIDASTALCCIDIADRDLVREVLRSTMVKEADRDHRFDAAFDRVFRAVGRDERRAAASGPAGTCCSPPAARRSSTR